MNDQVGDSNQIGMSGGNPLAAVIEAAEELAAPAELGQALVPVAFELSGHSFEADSEMAPQEELEMIRAKLPDPIVEPGAELLENLEAIPDKMAFKIGEAADMVGVKQYVLRYWETEFDMLRPRKSKNNQRVYSRRDVETAMMIKKLLYEDRYSIEGARSALRALKTHVKEDRGIKKMVASQETAVSKLRGLAAEIRRIRDLFN